MKKAVPTNAAITAADLLDAVAKNVRLLATSSKSQVNVDSVGQLAEGGQWVEMVDRFWRTLAFGTGGLRGRTIGRVVTAAEQGKAKVGERPEFPCVGTNAMNYFNISRAAQGLAAYCHEYFRVKKLKGRPLIVVAHDTRHYSREFAELVAKVAVDLGCDAGLVDSGALVRRSLHGRDGRRGDHRFPQPAAR